MCNRKYLLIITAAFLAAGARASVKLDYSLTGDGYSFWFPENDGGYVVVLWGREATPQGQNVYLGFHFYAVHGACPEETNSLCHDNLILLENGAGVAYQPVSVHLMEDTAVYEWARKYVKFKYVGDFAGPCTLLVKLRDGRTARLDLGPAECDFYRVGTVEAREGIDVHVAPDYASPVLRELRPGDTVYFTGRESHFWPEEDTMWYERLDFFEVICDGGRGWFPVYDEAKRLEYEKSTARSRRTKSVKLSNGARSRRLTCPTAARADGGEGNER